MRLDQVSNQTWTGASGAAGGFDGASSIREVASESARSSVLSDPHVLVPQEPRSEPSLARGMGAEFDRREQGTGGSCTEAYPQRPVFGKRIHW